MSATDSCTLASSIAVAHFLQACDFINSSHYNLQEVHHANFSDHSKYLPEQRSWLKGARVAADSLLVSDSQIVKQYLSFKDGNTLHITNDKWQCWQLSQVLAHVLGVWGQSPVWPRNRTGPFWQLDSEAVPLFQRWQDPANYTRLIHWSGNTVTCLCTDILNARTAQCNQSLHSDCKGPSELGWFNIRMISLGTKAVVSKSSYFTSILQDKKSTSLSAMGLSQCLPFLFVSEVDSQARWLLLTHSGRFEVAKADIYLCSVCKMKTASLPVFFG